MSSTFNRDYFELIIGTVVVQALGTILLVLSGVWMSESGGFGWTPKQVFNYHPLFMTIGMIYLFGNCMFHICL